MVGRPIGDRPRAHAGPLQDPRRHRQGRKRRSYSGPHGGRGLQDVMPGASLREEWFVSAHAAPKPPRVVRPVRGAGPVRASPVASGFGMVRGTRASAAPLARGAYAPPHRRARPRRMWAGLSKPERARIRSPRTGLLRPAAASAAVWFGVRPQPAPYGRPPAGRWHFPNWPVRRPRTAVGQRPSPCQRPCGKRRTGARRRRELRS